MLITTSNAQNALNFPLAGIATAPPERLGNVNMDLRQALPG
jgi:hypothetical protein